MMCLTIAFLLSFANNTCKDNNSILLSVGMSNNPRTLAVVCERSDKSTLIIDFNDFFKKNDCIVLEK